MKKTAIPSPAGDVTDDDQPDSQNPAPTKASATEKSRLSKAQRAALAKAFPQHLPVPSAKAAKSAKAAFDRARKASLARMKERQAVRLAARKKGPRPADIVREARALFGTEGGAQ